MPVSMHVKKNVQMSAIKLMLKSRKSPDETIDEEDLEDCGI